MKVVTILMLGTMPTTLLLALDTERSLVSKVEFDPNSIYAGVFDPNNIVIHVTQNLFNFLSSSFLWFLLLPVFRRQDDHVAGRRGRARTTKRDAPSPGRLLANALRKVAETAEIFDR